MSSSSRYNKGKGRAEQDYDDNDDMRDSPFEPEQPRKGPQVGSNSRSGQDDAKRRLVRNKSSQQQPPDDNDNNDNRKEPSNASTPTLDDGSTTEKQASREGTTTSSTTMQAAPSNSGGSVSGATTYSQQILHRPQKLRIREDVTKSTSFDRERDGDELYNLWVG